MSRWCPAIMMPTCGQLKNSRNAIGLISCAATMARAFPSCGGAARDLLAEHGAELVLHGHHHKASLHWLAGTSPRIPVVGVPSASGAPERHDEPAGYNLYEIEGAWGAWRCTAISRGRRGGGFDEIGRQVLFA